MTKNSNLSFFNRLWSLLGLTPIDPISYSKGNTSMSTNTFRAKVVSITVFPANDRGANAAILCRVFGKNGQTLKQSRLVDLKQGVTHQVIEQLKKAGMDKRAIIDIPLEAICEHQPEARERYKGDRFFTSTDRRTGEVTEEPIHRVSGLNVAGITVVLGTASVDDETLVRAVAEVETEVEAPKELALAGAESDEIEY